MATPHSHASPERIMQFAFGYSAPLIIEAAVRNRVFDTLADGPRTVEEVSRQTGASIRGLRMIMNALVGFDLLARNGDGRYALVPESDTFLVSSRPAFFGGIFKHISSQLIKAWLDLTEIVRTGEPVKAVNQEEAGVEFFRQFVADIFPMSAGPAAALAEAMKVADAREPYSVLDIAAGSGVWGISLARRSPMVRVRAVDWEGVLPVTRQMAEKFGVADRFQFIAGDLQHADFGSGHKLATLGHILHSEGRERSRTLIKSVFQALASGGTIAIQEFLVNDDRTGPPMGLIFAVNMLVNTQEGDTYSLKEISGWLEQAGFVNVRTLEAPGPSPLILATKP
ncbi:MAG TPA: methyltransferase dimerization domain-containing protein [Bryobacteraceae bacterium]|nr:methyltransferase dimerization domain-containing protein [Bryobacteraceae bacterium]